ncbi:MAG: DUF6320 domain-containing protein [Christensenella sp.]|uniref:DUF6320 domain-containing protein n=1 Tax=Christensenella sp. TaxID=1935934 RepID=UPI002B1F30B5|nr:DUF6320 domain-containing protein [Christensenella sp.]MEA5002945.1 DUF6320 domain-containing protein [Christensenella sp.]
MRNCEYCNVRVDENLTTCPLCERKLTGQQGAEAKHTYPAYARKDEKYAAPAGNGKYKALVVTMLIVAVCAFINLLTRGEAGGYWFLDVAVVLGYIWVLVLHTIRSKARGSVKFFAQVCMISLMLIVFDLNAGGGLWSLLFGLPIEAVAMISLATFIVCRRKMLWSEYVLYGFMILFIGFAPMIAVQMGFVPMFWTFFMSAGYAVVTCLFMLMFANKQYKQTAVRRVHF